MMTSIDDVGSTVKERPDLDSVSAKMSQSQRALELRVCVAVSKHNLSYPRIRAHTICTFKH